MQFLENYYLSDDKIQDIPKKIFTIVQEFKSE